MEARVHESALSQPVQHSIRSVRARRRESPVRQVVRRSTVYDRSGAGDRGSVDIQLQRISTAPETGQLQSGRGHAENGNAQSRCIAVAGYFEKSETKLELRNCTGAL